MFNQRISGILDHKSSLDHIPLGRIESLVLDHVSQCCLLARIDFLCLLAACKRGSDLRCLDRSLGYVIFRLECTRFIRLIRIRICYVLTLSRVPITVLIVGLVLLVYPVSIMTLIIERVRILSLGCKIFLRNIAYNCSISDYSLFTRLKSYVRNKLILALIVPGTFSVELHIFQFWNSEIFRILSELIRYIHRENDVAGVFYMDFVFNFILCEKSILVALRRSLSGTNLVHLIGRLHRFPRYGLAFIIDLFVLCSNMAFSIIDLFEYDCVLAIKACCIKCECHFDLAIRHECLEFLLSSDLIAVYVNDRLLSGLVHQDALGGVGLTLLEILILDNVNECDLLLRANILVLAID